MAINRECIAEVMKKFLLSDNTGIHKLSMAEQKVIVAVAHGKTLTELAVKRNLSIRTLSTQKRNAYKKINIKSDVEFIHYIYTFIGR
ncbi:hypothetical protein Z042_08465 [Chania multitudinisentens RB-25]|uniref:HTH luxR-type domain-containing protein n=1 Tax=Chania multitudinisentens RB-25 TaxID=1441930 RepID=W0L762_9GAMM|nr:helix-turn-helix transcriptional regulator [Chania multitudinisentens]AHG19648.1 hypothetical protein Z042_08465 [Chania multitudinisentens RB-25]